MADEIEINNVGGNGVASEVTLLRLVASVEEMARAKGLDPKSAHAKVMAEFAKTSDKANDNLDYFSDEAKKSGKEQDKTTKATIKLGKAMANTAASMAGSLLGSAVGFANELMQGGTDVSNFTRHLSVFGQLLTPFATYIDNTIHTFRELSSSGASFNNNMLDMRRGAAGMELSLTEFAGVIGNNSEALAALGGTVTDGAARFARMNRNIKASGDFQNLKEMGFTVLEINEGMADYIDLQARMGNLQGRSTQSLAEGSANYLRQIDLLAKVTGKTREEAEKALREQSTDASVRTLLDQFRDINGNLNEQGLNLQASLGLIDEVGGAAGTAMKDLLDGMPSGPETGQFLSMLGESGPAIQEALKAIGDGADPQVLLDAMKQGGGELERFANMDADARAQYIQVLRRQNPVMADFLDGATRMISLGNRDLAAAQNEQSFRDKASAALATFDDAIRGVRSTIEGAFLKSGLFENFAEGVESMKKIFESPEFKAKVENFVKTITTELNNIINVFKTDGFSGVWDYITKEDGPIARAFDWLKEKLTAMWDSVTTSVGDWLKETGKAAMSSMWEGFKNWFLENWDTILVGALAGIGAIIAAPVIGVFGAIAVGIAAMIGWEKLKTEYLQPAWDKITGVFTSIKDWWDKLDFKQMLSDTWEKVKGWFSFGESDFSISQLATKAWETVKGFFTWQADTIGLGISILATKAWETVEGFFAWGEEATGFSISGLLTTAWETVTGFFAWGENTSAFSISGLLTTAWETVTGFFAWGENTSAFSISGLLTTAWETVTGMFSFGELAIPSISSMFQGIIDKVKGFFTFDFEMPNFKQYLPTWLGGEGKSLFGDDNETTAPSTNNNTSNLDVEPAVNGAMNLSNAQNAIASFASLPELQNNLDILKNGLDVDQVRSYTSSMERLVEVLEDLNEELSKDNQFGPGSGENAGSVLAKMDSIGGGDNEQLTAIMNNVLAVLFQINESNSQINRNTRNISGSNIAQGYVSNIG